MKTNERTIEPSDLIRFNTETLETTISIAPGFEVHESRTHIELTNEGRKFLNDVYEMYAADTLSVDELISLFQSIADYWSGWSSMVVDKLFHELSKIG